MKKAEIFCANCSESHFEINDKFTTDKPFNGSMCTLKQKYIDSGLSTFPLYDSSEYANVICPACGYQLLDSVGYLLRAVEGPKKVPKGQVQCKYCEGMFSPGGMHFHVKAKHPEMVGV